MKKIQTLFPCRFFWYNIPTILEKLKGLKKQNMDYYTDVMKLI